MNFLLGFAVTCMGSMLIWTLGYRMGWRDRESFECLKADTEEASSSE